MEPRYIVHHVDDDGVERTETLTCCRDAEWGAKALRGLGRRAWVTASAANSPPRDDDAHD